MRYHKRQIRKAFTLVELIIVITIIVVIASLTIGAIGKSFTWIRQKNTEQTMTKALERVVQRRIRELYREAKEWETPLIIYEQAAGSPERAEVLKVLYLYKWQFPQTYSEAFFNILESQALYDATNGHPIARSLYQRIKSKCPSGLTDAQIIATPATADMSRVLQLQMSVCLACAFETSRGSSLDEFTKDEITTLGVNQQDIPPQASLPTGAVSSNRVLTDGWGTPLIFLRHGNFWDDEGARAAVAVGSRRAPFWLGIVNPPVTPLVSLLGNGYFDVLMNRAQGSFASLWNSDPFDPTGLLRDTNGWKSLIITGTPAATPTTWLAPSNYAANPVLLNYQPPNLCQPTSGSGFTSTQHQDYFRSNFGYRPSNNPTGGVFPWQQEYAPFVIISAGGDKLFTTWEDNLDSYRLKINVSGQQ
jgi:prepilin-type N-terminal cleavage/methylation domain-containing protein